MRCDDAHERLLDLKAGEAPGPELQAHLEACPPCRAEAAGTARLLAAAALLPRAVAPARDLWPAVAARLGPRRSFAPRLLPLAAAAALLFALILLVPWRGGGAGTLLASTLQAEARDWEASREAIRNALTEPEPSGEAGVHQTISRNLEVLAHSRRDVLAALAATPGDPTLAEMLLFLHERQLDLLQAAWNWR